MRRWMLVVLIVVAAVFLGGYALAQPSSAPKASSNRHGWTSYAPLAPLRRAVIAKAPRATGTGRVMPLPLLEGDGIARVKFGQPPDVVAAKLARLFGPPDAANKIPNGYIRFRCGYHYEQWNGLGAASNGHLFYAELLVWFRKGRLAGYQYLDNNMETRYGLGLTDRKQPARRRTMLATARGLAVGDSLVRGQRLYGRSFVVTAQMQGRPPILGRFAAWKASTASGRIEGTSGSPILIEGAIDKSSSRYSRHWRSIDGIDAGSSPRPSC